MRTSKRIFIFACISAFVFVIYLCLLLLSPSITTGLKPNGEFNNPTERGIWSLFPSIISSRSTRPGGAASFKTPRKAIMTKMSNETQRAQLGQSSWYLLHVMSAKFPVNPTVQEQQAFLDFVSLFSQLYPCGECAEHFQSLLVRHPPQVASRKQVVQWACEAHNLVNERLNKTIMNCDGIEKLYGCGCGGDFEVDP